MHANHLAGLTLLTAAAACAPDPTRLGGATMGTTWAVTLPELPAGIARGALQRVVQAVLDGVEARMSTWRPDSELTRFNRSLSCDWFAVSPDTAAVVAEALRVARLTQGAFDPTVGPLVDLWGFGPGGRAAVPDEPELARAHERVGYGYLDARGSPPALRKRHPALALDLSGIAKGFAADRVAERLAELGAPAFLVEVGGELVARGGRAPGEPWRVGLERPLAEARRVQRVLALEDRAVATSGDYRRFHEHGGARTTHVIDPRTGRPVQRGVASATVLAASAAEADALATAMLVLGPEAGLDLARREGLEVLLLLREEDGIVERGTAALQGGGIQ